MKSAAAQAYGENFPVERALSDVWTSKSRGFRTDGFAWSGSGSRSTRYDELYDPIAPVAPRRPGVIPAARGQAGGRRADHG